MLEMRLMLMVCVLFVFEGHTPALSCAPDNRVAECLALILYEMYPSAAAKSFGVFANSLQGRFQCALFPCVANIFTGEIRNCNIYTATCIYKGFVLSLRCVITKYYASVMIWF